MSNVPNGIYTPNIRNGLPLPGTLLDVGSTRETADAIMLLAFLTLGLVFRNTQRDADGVITVSSVIWPDGGTGTYTMTEKDDVVLKPNAWTVSHVQSKRIYEQPPVTRNADADIIDQPEPIIFQYYN